MDTSEGDGFRDFLNVDKFCLSSLVIQVFLVLFTKMCILISTVWPAWTSWKLDNTKKIPRNFLLEKMRVLR